MPMRWCCAAAQAVCHRPRTFIAETLRGQTANRGVAEGHPGPCAEAPEILLNAGVSVGINSAIVICGGLQHPGSLHLQGLRFRDLVRWRPGLSDLGPLARAMTPPSSRAVAGIFVSATAVAGMTIDRDNDGDQAAGAGATTGPNANIVHWNGHRVLGCEAEASSSIQSPDHAAAALIRRSAWLAERRPQQVLTVLGMHCSGTSLLTGCRRSASCWGML